MKEATGTEDSTAEKKSKSRRNRRLKVIFIVYLAVMLLLLLLLVILFTCQSKAAPTIVVADPVNGIWNFNEEIAVFDGRIKPGSSGQITFNIRNRNSYAVKYTLTLTEMIDGISVSSYDIEGFPMRYRLRSGDFVLAPEGRDFGSASEILLTGYLIPAASEQEFVLEWAWPLDGGDDSLDTLLGSLSHQKGGMKYSITATLVAEQETGQTVTREPLALLPLSAQSELRRK